MPKSERSVQISDRKYRLKPQRYGLDVRFQHYWHSFAMNAEIRTIEWTERLNEPNDWMNRTIRTSLFERLIVWILDVRISAFHCTVNVRNPNILFGKPNIFVFGFWLSGLNFKAEMVRLSKVRVSDSRDQTKLFRSVWSQLSEIWILDNEQVSC